MHRYSFHAHALAALALCLGLSWSHPTRADDLDEARSLASSGRYEEALERADAYLAGDGDHVEARLFRGVILTRLGRTEAAIEVFRELAQAHPDLPEPHNNLAVLYAAQSRYDEARAALVQAIELQPRYDTAHENLGDIYAKLAALAYDRATELNPDNRRAREKAQIIENAFESRNARAPSSPTAAPSAPSPPSTASAQPVSVAPSGAACFRVEGMRGGERIEAMRAWLEERGARSSVVEREENALVNYKIFLPPLESREAADAKIREIEARGIVDIIRIPRGDLENGIALGVYSSAEGVERRIAHLRDLGYEAHSQPRYETRVVEGIFAESDSAEIDAAAFARAFPGRSLAAAPCS